MWAVLLLLVLLTGMQFLLELMHKTHLYSEKNNYSEVQSVYNSLFCLDYKFWIVTFQICYIFVNQRWEKKKENHGNVCSKKRMFIQVIFINEVAMLEWSYDHERQDSCKLNFYRINTVYNYLLHRTQFNEL